MPPDLNFAVSSGPATAKLPDKGSGAAGDGESSGTGGGVTTTDAEDDTDGDDATGSRLGGVFMVIASMHSGS
jgi:hypothetical protein